MMQSEPSELLTAEFTEYAGKCPPLPELFEVASEFIISLSKAQQVQLIDCLETRQDLKIKEKDSLILLKIKASLVKVQRTENLELDELRTLRHTIEGLKSEVEAIKCGGNPPFEEFAKELTQAQDSLRNKLQGKLTSQRNKVRDLRKGQAALIKEVNGLKLQSANLKSAVQEGQQEMREVEGRLRRDVEVHSSEVKGEMHDLKKHFTMTEEAIKTDIDHIRHSLAYLEALVAEQARLNAPLNAIPPVELDPLVEVRRPHKIGSYQCGTSNFHWIDIETGEEGTQALPNYTFQHGSSVCEGPDNLLFITGGSSRQQEVVSVQMDSLALKSCPPMLNPRQAHGSAYFGGWLYVIGGWETKLCERYDLQQTWTAIPPLPTTASNYWGMGVVVSCDKLYCLGG
jgi:hypothetical protein